MKKNWHLHLERRSGWFDCRSFATGKSIKRYNRWKTNKATVIVDDDQYSLAIGRNGQNARLAAYVTNWKIDIKISDAKEEGLEFEYNVAG